MLIDFEYAIEIYKKVEDVGFTFLERG